MYAECVAQELIDEVCMYLESVHVFGSKQKKYFGITYNVDKNDSVSEAFLDLKQPLKCQLRHASEKKLEFRVLSV